MIEVSALAQGALSRETHAGQDIFMHLSSTARKHEKQYVTTQKEIEMGMLTLRNSNNDYRNRKHLLGVPGAIPQAAELAKKSSTRCSINHFNLRQPRS